MQISASPDTENDRTTFSVQLNHVGPPVSDHLEQDEVAVVPKFFNHSSNSYESLQNIVQTSSGDTITTVADTPEGERAIYLTVYDPAELLPGGDIRDSEQFPIPVVEPTLRSRQTTIDDDTSILTMTIEFSDYGDYDGSWEIIELYYQGSRILQGSLATSLEAPGTIVLTGNLNAAGITLPLTGIMTYNILDPAFRSQAKYRIVDGEVEMVNGLTVTRNEEATETLSNGGTAQPKAGTLALVLPASSGGEEVLFS